MAKKFRSGQRCPRSGQYVIVNPSGKRTGVERTVVRGEPFPPTPKAGQGFVISDVTKH
jgi:hypothetical protein